MADFENTFQWSITRQRSFDDCKRLYYYRYYGMWNGWEFNAPEEARKCYRFSKMTNLPMLAGRVVHHLIEELLKGQRKHRPLPTLDNLQDSAVKRLNHAWKQSRQRRWLTAPKRNVNLFEHYYERQITETDRSTTRERVLGSLANFYHSDVFARIKCIEPSNWKSIEEFQSFQIDGFKVGLSIDFALDSAGTLEIYDWKTGKEDEAGIEQLVCYALYGEHHWGYYPDNISLNLFYLNENNLHQFRVQPDQRAETIEKIVHNCRLMQDLLTEPDQNIARKEDFPMTSNQDTCKQCFYQELCYGGPI